MVHVIVRFFLVLVALLISFSFVNAEVNVSPLGISASMDEGEVEEVAVTLSNNGETDVVFDIKFRKVDREEEEDRRGPQRDDLGDEIGRFTWNRAGNGAYKAGISHDIDNNWLWLASYTASFIAAVDIDDDYEVVVETNSQNAMDNAWADGVLYQIQWAQNVLFRFDADAERIGQVNLNFQPTAVASDPDEMLLFVVNSANYSLHILDIEDDYEQIGVLQNLRQFTNGANIRSIEWVNHHPDGQLWMNSVRHLWQIAVDTDEWTGELVNDINRFGQDDWDGIGHNGEDLVLSTRGEGEYRIWDDGISEARWFSVLPKEGNIAAGEEIEITITFDSNEIEAGVYEMLLEVQFENGELTPVQFAIVLSVESPTYSITGTVSDPANGDAAIEGVIAEMDYFVMDRFSDAEGSYSFSDLPQQDYVLTFTAEDYLPFIQDVEPGEEGDVEHNIGLLHSESTPNVDDISEVISPEEMIEVQFRITNGGNGPLTYTSERRLVGEANAELYTIRDEIFVGADREDIFIRGVIYTNDRFYISGSNNRDPVIYVHDRNGDHIETFQQPIDHRNGMRDLAFDGEILWGPIESTMYGITLDGEVEAEFELPYNNTTCVAYDPDRELLWVASTTVGIKGIDRDGNEEAELNRHGLRMYGLSYWPTDPDGYNLYIYNMVPIDREDDRPALHKINTDNGDIMFVAWLDTELGGTAMGSYLTNEYDIYSWVMVSVASAANNAGGDRIDIWQIDARKEWMQVEPMAGVIEADESEEFTLTFDATGLPEAQFEGELVFTHDGVGGETIIPLTLNVIEVEIHTTKTLDLHRGWNMVSVYLQPDEQDLEVIMGPLLEQDLLLMMKDGAGNFYSPEEEFNNIDGWQVDEGYLIKLSDPGELTLEGETVLVGEPIALEEGWQIISCYLRFPIDATLAFLDIADQMMIVKNEAGDFYIPEFDFSNMGDVASLKGYQLKMSEAVEFVYRFQLDNEEEDRVMLPRGNRNPNLLGVHASTGSNMSLLVMSAHNLSGDVGVYSDNVLVGSGVLSDGSCGIAIWGDDPSTKAIDGASAGAALELRLFDGTTFSTLTYTNLRGTGSYSTDGLWVVKLDNDQALPTEFGIESVYPNPFNSQTLIKFGLADASTTELHLYDLTGRLIREMSLGRLSAGNHTITVDGADLSSGIYLIELSAGSEVSRRKLTLIK